MSEFEPFPKIPRLKVHCVITEKLDGTNGQILFAEDGTMKAGSRNRWLEAGRDNFGFFDWASCNRAELFQLLGPGRHFGEWWGSGIQRRYGRSSKTFSLFNTARWRHLFDAPNAQTLADPETYAAFLSRQDLAQRIGLGVVPTMHVGEYSEAIIDSCTDALRRHGSLAAPGFMDPEGVVVQLGSYGRHDGSLFKVIISGEKPAVRNEHDLLP